MKERAEHRFDWIEAMNLASALLTLLALLIFLFAAGTWLMHRPYFALRSVRVESMDHSALRHVDVATVRASAMPAVRGNFFTVKLSNVREGFENVAWVRHARVRRQWPDTLVVSVEEHRVAALWNDDALVDTFGDAFTANIAEAQADGELPQLNGPLGTQRDVLQHYADFTRDFAKLGLKPIEVSLSPRYSWTTRLDNGTTQGLLVEFGRESSDAASLNDRIDRMLATYAAVTAKWPRLTLIDLRYPNGFAIRADGLHLAPEAQGKGAAHATHIPHAVAPHASHLKT